MVCATGPWLLNPDFKFLPVAFCVSAIIYFLSSIDLDAIDALAWSRSTAVNFTADYKVGSNFFGFGATATCLDFEGEELLTVVDLISDAVFDKI